MLCSKMLKNLYIKINCSHHCVRAGRPPRDDSQKKKIPGYMWDIKI